MKIRSVFGGAAIAALVFSPALASEIEQTDLGTFPAVSALNGKVEAGYSRYDLDSLIYDGASGYFVKGSVSVPLSQRFGLQIDAGAQETEMDRTSMFTTSGDVDVSSSGVGGHVFWRDPSAGLLGAYAHYEQHEFSQSGGGSSLEAFTYRVGVEGELYWDAWTFNGFLGYDHLDIESYGHDGFVAVKLQADYYLTENAVVSAGFKHSFESTFATVGAEVLIGSGKYSPTVFASGSFGKDTVSASFGLKLMLAPAAKSLMRRHREDDPDNGVFENNDGILQCFSNTEGTGGGEIHCSGDGPRPA